MVYENNKSHKGDESHKEKPQGGQIEPPSSLFGLKCKHKFIWSWVWTQNAEDGQSLIFVLQNTMVAMSHYGP